MLLYRITTDKEEIRKYEQKIIHFNNEPVFFNKPNPASIYKLNTFPYEDKMYKHFYYFPQDAFEISKLLLKFSSYYHPKIYNINILEYSVDNMTVLNKIGFGNYGGLHRLDYIPKELNKKINNSSYPVIEFRLDKQDSIYPTEKKWIISKLDPLPNDLNDLVKLKQFIYYKIHCEDILNDFNVNYPHNKNGIMKICMDNNNIKEIVIPKKYIKYLY